jgi:aspartate/methionine/tyrosine aminotransferase
VPRIDPFEMERMQSRYWHLVEHDLSESGVEPLTLRELHEIAGADPQAFLGTALGYPLSEGSEEARAAVAGWYPGADVSNVTLVNGGSEANLLVLWALLGPGDRLAFMMPNYLQGLGLGSFFSEGTDTFGLVRQADRWALDTDGLSRAVGRSTKVVMVCNPNNPTGAVLRSDEMDAIVEAASSVGAWIVADEIYRGAEIEGGEASPTFWGRYDRVVVTSGLSKAFGMPGLRVGWIVAPPELIGQVWERHDYTTLTPSMAADRLVPTALAPATRERILERTRSIVRANLPPVEGWIASSPALSHVPPVAGAIVYVEYSLDVEPRALCERARREQSVLLVPGDMFGLDRGFRIGFGFDLEGTLKGLERVSRVLL